MWTDLETGIAEDLAEAQQPSRQNEAAARWWAARREAARCKELRRRPRNRKRPQSPVLRTCPCGARFVFFTGTPGRPPEHCSRPCQERYAKRRQRGLIACPDNLAHPSLCEEQEAMIKGEGVRTTVVTSVSTREALPADVIAALQTLLRDVGEVEVLRRCRLSRMALYRAMAGQDLNPGTVLCIQQGLRSGPEAA